MEKEHTMEIITSSSKKQEMDEINSEYANGSKY
jgi:hypothetical protein